MPKKSRVTSRDVARHAGVSQTTVSFVLNRKRAGKISQQTSDKVWAAAEELGYVPDAAARSLARGYSSNIALVTTNPHQQVYIDDYIPNIITGLMRSVREQGFRVVLEQVDSGNPVELVRELARGREVGGVIIVPYENADQHMDTLLELRRDGFPLIVLSHIDERMPSVAVNNLDGVREMTRHLVGLGHQHIACISYSPLANNPHANDRVAAIRETLHTDDLSLPEAYLVEGAFDPHTGYAAAQHLLALPAPPTAIQCLNDTMALGAIAAIQDAGLRVPEDIAVVGFDDIRVAPFVSPPLTTIHAPEVELGVRSGSLMLDLIHGQPVADLHIDLDTQLVVRASCGARTEPASYFRHSSEEGVTIQNHQ